MNVSRMFYIANLPPGRTGLDCQIWYSAKTPKHRPRIKVDIVNKEPDLYKKYFAD
jgi:hypothetical protein